MSEGLTREKLQACYDLLAAPLAFEDWQRRAYQQNVYDCIQKIKEERGSRHPLARTTLLQWQVSMLDGILQGIDDSEPIHEPTSPYVWAGAVKILAHVELAKTSFLS